MLATEGGTRFLPMPVHPQSTYSDLHKIMELAHERTHSADDPDPWFDQGDLDAPLWGHHSLRRLADTVARQTMSRTGATEMDIDLMFGWNERMYSAKMQLHYAETFTRDVRHRVTMYLLTSHGFDWTPKARCRNRSIAAFSIVGWSSIVHAGRNSR